MILFGEDALRTAVNEFIAHYHGERNHQGIGNLLISLTPISRDVTDQSGVEGCVMKASVSVFGHCAVMRLPSFK